MAYLEERKDRWVVFLNFYKLHYRAWTATDIWFIWISKVVTHSKLLLQLLKSLQNIIFHVLGWGKIMCLINIDC